MLTGVLVSGCVSGRGLSWRVGGGIPLGEGRCCLVVCLGPVGICLVEIFVVGGTQSTCLSMVWRTCLPLPLGVGRGRRG